MLDYGSLSAVAAVVREGSFGRAALGVTASAVSQRGRVLEERLGCVLVVRKSIPTNHREVKCRSSASTLRISRPRQPISPRHLAECHYE